MINGKQFKRIFGIILFVLFGFGFNSSFADVQVLEIGQELVPSAGGYNSTYIQGINEDGTYYVSNGSIIKNNLIFGYTYNYSSSYYSNFRFFGNYNTGIALFNFPNGNGTNYDFTVIENFRVYPYISMVPNKQPTTNCSATKPDNFTGNVCYTKNINDLGEEYIGKFSGLYFENNRKLIACLIFEELNEVFCPGDTVKSSGNNDYHWTGDVSITFENFDDSLAIVPYFISSDSDSSSTVIYTNSDLDKVISYYETRYNRNESMCYVGTFDTGSSYGTPGIDFVSGTGNSVFGLYHELYNGYGNNIIKNVGSWINVRLINYSERFYNNDNIRYLANYNGPDTNISLYYTGFTFPFANKPVALYFMASNLYDGYSRESTQGEEMSYYCYSKLNYQQIKDGDINFDTVKEMVSTGINERLDTYYNYHIVNNSGSYITPSSGSFWDAFGTGYEETDLDLDTTFSDFFDKITSFFANYSPSYSTGIIPDWILYPLIFLILFRIMKH